MISDPVTVAGRAPVPSEPTDCSQAVIHFRPDLCARVLQACLPFTSTDNTPPILTSLNFCYSLPGSADSRLIIAATDGHRLIQVEISDLALADVSALQANADYLILREDIRGLIALAKAAAKRKDATFPLPVMRRDCTFISYAQEIPPQAPLCSAKGVQATRQDVRLGFSAAYMIDACNAIRQLDGIRNRNPVLELSLGGASSPARVDCRGNGYSATVVVMPVVL